MNPNKRFTDLKVKQQELISEWLYTATYSFYRDKKRMPNKSERIVILDTVYNKIKKLGYGFHTTKSEHVICPD